MALSSELNSIKNAGTIPDTNAVTKIAVRIPARRVALRSFAIAETGDECFCFDFREPNTVCPKERSSGPQGFIDLQSIEASAARRR